MGTWEIRTVVDFLQLGSGDVFLEGLGIWGYGLKKVGTMVRRCLCRYAFGVSAEYLRRGASEASNCLA